MKRHLILVLSTIIVFLGGCGNVGSGTTESSILTNDEPIAMESVVDESENSESSGASEDEFALFSDKSMGQNVSDEHILIPRNPGMSVECTAENELSYYEIELDPSLKPQYIDGGLSTPYLDLDTMAIDTVSYIEDLGFKPTTYDPGKYELELTDYTITIWARSDGVYGDYLIIGFASKLGEPGMRYELCLTLGDYDTSNGKVTDSNLGVTMPLSITNSVYQVIKNSLQTQAPLDYVYINCEIFVYPPEVVYVEADPYTTAIYQNSYWCFWDSENEIKAPHLDCPVWYADGGPEL